MKRLNTILRVTFSLAAMFAIVFLSQAESGNKRATATQQKRSANHEIQIVDQNGNPAVSGVPSGTSQIVDVAVGQDGFTFTPDNIYLRRGYRQMDLVQQRPQCQQRTSLFCGFAILFS